MSDELKTVWVLIKHEGYEGFSEPSYAFTDKSTAEQVQSLCKEASYGGDWRVVEVPYWLNNG